MRTGIVQSVIPDGNGGSTIILTNGMPIRSRWNDASSVEKGDTIEWSTNGTWNRNEWFDGLKVIS